MRKGQLHGERVPATPPDLWSRIARFICQCDVCGARRPCGSMTVATGPVGMRNVCPWHLRGEINDD